MLLKMELREFLLVLGIIIWGKAGSSTNIFINILKMKLNIYSTSIIPLLIKQCC